MRTGVVGLGQMGSAIAERLAATGFDVIGHDLRAIPVPGVTKGGPGTLGAVDVLISSLPADEQVLAVLDDAVLRRLAGGILVEASTTLPDTVREIAERARRHGVAVLDVPVSGSPGNARDGRLTLLAGGDPVVLDRASPVLAALGTVQVAGDVGDGKITKLVNNMMAMGNMAVAAEAFALGERLGMEPRRLFATLDRSGGRSHHFSTRMPWVLDGDFAPRFAVRLGAKDLRLAQELAAGAGHPAPVCAVVRGVFEEAATRGNADEDMSAVIKNFRD